jgi:glycosyltransferase involved in cell wall biosynthesis
MDKKDVRLALVFKDFCAWLHVSCIGLNIAGYTTAKVLQENGIDTVVFPVRDNIDVVNDINKYNQEHDVKLTHVVIAAPWLSVFDLRAILTAYPDIQFCIESHSNVGFLQADPGAVELLREYLKLMNEFSNLQVAGNSPFFVEWLELAYGQEVVLLPNLYPLERHNKRPAWDGDPLKIGAFGAVRPEKNFMTAAAAAVVIQKELNVPVEFHMSTGGEGDQGRVAPAIKQMTDGIEGFTLVRHDWELWDKFIKRVSNMDLLIQVSYTESFNMVTADGISVGVPSVVSPAIYWAPENWKVNPDSAVAVAHLGEEILLSEKLKNEGFHSLKRHNELGLKNWFRFLGIPEHHWYDF